MYVWFAHTRIDMASSKAIAETYALCCRSLFQKALFELRAQPTDDAYDDGAKLFGRCSTAHRTGSTYLILPMLLDWKFLLLKVFNATYWLKVFAIESFQCCCIESFQCCCIESFLNGSSLAALRSLTVHQSIYLVRTVSSTDHLTSM